MTKEMTEKKELNEIFKRASVCHSFNLNGLQEVLKRTNLPVKSTELIWQIGDLNARDYLKVDSSVSSYIVNREKAEPEIQELQTSPLFCPLHDAWHDWFRSEFEEHFKVEDLAALLYHEATYRKRCRSTGKKVLDFLKSKIQDYLWMYCRAVAKELKIPLSVSISDLRQAFVTLLSSMESEHQDTRKEVAEYISKLIQQFQLINEANMFKHVLSSSEYKSFIEFLTSLNPI